MHVHLRGPGYGESTTKHEASLFLLTSLLPCRLKRHTIFLRTYHRPCAELRIRLRTVFFTALPLAVSCRILWDELSSLVCGAGCEAIRLQHTMSVSHLVARGRQPQIPKTPGVQFPTSGRKNNVFAMSLMSTWKESFLRPTRKVKDRTLNREDTICFSK